MLRDFSTCISRLLFGLVWLLTCHCNSATGQTRNLTELPMGVTSFGAACIDGKAYLYGGHTGRPHSYSMDGISEKLLCLDLNSKGASWQEVSQGPKLQGLAMIAHGGALYRIGGLTIERIAPFNASETAPEVKEFSEDETNTSPGTKILSVDSVSAFLPETGKWVSLPPLPEPRSSHDAVVVGDTIYVFGGWNLVDGIENWAANGYKLDLKAKPLKWETVAMPAVKRRAMSLAATGSKIYMIGGMSEHGETISDVEVFDTSLNKWSKAAPIPDEGSLAGFGNSSFAVGGKIYCQSFDGVLRGT